ncbi:1-phosphofructokinase family hexose kinase [Brachybacterium sp. MASK1Z-5]|uniref:1-phosphofructokinase family hexose kinase n=1 Tax=Brachybacterium halotolerans TaxID=2795215 RepID=A0ABS1BA06_9MICO|nr:1-phosphofructokinase family hexose kinase [Brachybacterium halotolerans]MBK0331466.1 1-phosphofructokinase family hexose kinase [Brachybacterium halotolerans]
MILVLTPNPALDVTYEVAGPVRVHGEQRVQRVRTVAGGKGVNVARVLAALGESSVLVGPVGGSSGEELVGLLDGHGAAQHGAVQHGVVQHGVVEQAWTRVAGATRRTVTVVDPEGATGFYEPGPMLSPEERDRVLAGVRERAQGADVVVISGSLAPGMAGEDVSALVAELRGAGLPVVVDTSGPALLDAARAGASVLKPNLGEVRAATGIDDPIAACRSLIALGAGAVLCSLGPDGMLAVTADAALRATPPHALSGNPTGAGDASVAAASRALARGDGLADLLRSAVAVSASAVTRPVAGEIDRALAQDLRGAIAVEQVPSAPTVPASPGSTAPTSPTAPTAPMPPSHPLEQP